MNAATDSSGNIMPEFYEVKTMKKAKTMKNVKTGVTTSSPVSTGIALETEDDDTGEGDEDSGEKPHSQSQRDAASSFKPIQVHDTTIPHLTFVEKIILDALVLQGRAVIVTEMLGQPAGAREHGIGTLKN